MQMGISLLAGGGRSDEVKPLSLFKSENFQEMPNVL